MPASTRGDVLVVRVVIRADATTAWSLAQTLEGREEMLKEFDRDTFSKAGHVVSRPS